MVSWSGSHNIKISSYQYEKSPCRDNGLGRLSTEQNNSFFSCWWRFRNVIFLVNRVTSFQKGDKISRNLASLWLSKIHLAKSRYEFTTLVQQDVIRHNTLTSECLLHGNTSATSCINNKHSCFQHKYNKLNGIPWKIEIKNICIKHKHPTLSFRGFSYSTNSTQENLG